MFAIVKCQPTPVNVLRPGPSREGVLVRRDRPGPLFGSWSVARRAGGPHLSRCSVALRAVFREVSAFPLVFLHHPGFLFTIPFVYLCTYFWCFILGSLGDIYFLLSPTVHQTCVCCNLSQI